MTAIPSPASTSGAGAPVLLQAVGVVANFGVVLVIARGWGPAAQGEFAQLRAWVDLANGIVALGLPQAVVLAINRDGADPRCLGLWLSAGLAAMLPVLCFAAFLAATAGLLPGLQAPDHRPFVYALAAAAALAAFCNLWRGLYLARRPDTVFGLISALPGVSLLAVTIAIALSTGWPRVPAAQAAAPAAADAAGPVLAAPAFAGAIFVGAALAAGAAWALAWPRLRAAGRREGGADGRRGTARPVAWGRLFRTGGQGLLQLLAILALPFALYALLRFQGASAIQIGFASLFVHAVTALVAPCELLAPVLLSRFSRVSHAEGHEACRHLLRRLRPWLLPATAAAMVAIAAAVPWLFGPAYAEARLPLALAAVVAVPASIARLCAPALFGGGEAHRVSQLWWLRLGLTLGLVAVLPAASGSALLFTLAGAWFVAESVVAGLAVHWLRPGADRVVATTLADDAR